MRYFHSHSQLAYFTYIYLLVFYVHITILDVKKLITKDCSIIVFLAFYIGFRSKNIGFLNNATEKILLYSSPEFLATSFEGRVFETAALGASVVQVQAIDRDHDKNAEIKYSILSGKMAYFNNKHFMLLKKPLIWPLPTQGWILVCLYIASVFSYLWIFRQNTLQILVSLISTYRK